MNAISGLIQKCIFVICPCRRREPAPARARPHPQPPRRVLNSTNRQPSPCTRQVTSSSRQQQVTAAALSAAVAVAAAAGYSSSWGSNQSIRGARTTLTPPPAAPVGMPLAQQGRACGIAPACRQENALRQTHPLFQSHHHNGRIQFAETDSRQLIHKEYRRKKALRK